MLNRDYFIPLEFSFSPDSVRLDHAGLVDIYDALVSAGIDVDVDNHTNIALRGFGSRRYWRITRANLYAGNPDMQAPGGIWFFHDYLHSALSIVDGCYVGFRDEMSLESVTDIERIVSLVQNVDNL